MPVARFKKVCVDAMDAARLGIFWARALDLTWVPAANGEGGVYASARTPVLWVCRVPEPKAVKHRVHPHIYSSNVQDLVGLGARVLVAEHRDRRWTGLVDPEGGEFCAMPSSPPAGSRLHSLVVDSADPAAQARWWADLLGTDVGHHRPDSWSLSGVPGLGFALDFVAAPEPPPAKNRIHWEVTVQDVRSLVVAGARIVHPLGGDRQWDVLADPGGNLFCAFTVAPADSAQ